MEVFGIERSTYTHTPALYIKFIEHTGIMLRICCRTRCLRNFSTYGREGMLLTLGLPLLNATLSLCVCVWGMSGILIRFRGSMCVNMEGHKRLQEG